MGIQGYIIGALIAVLVAAGTVGYFVINGIVADNRTLAANNAKLTLALDVERAEKVNAERRVQEWKEAEARSRRDLEAWEKVRRQAEDEARSGADTSARAKEIEDAARKDAAKLEADLDARGAAERERLRRDSED